MDIDNFRRKIDDIDRHILGLLNERVALVGMIGEAKRAEGGSVYVPAREEALIQKLLMANTGSLKEEEIRPIFREIISACIARQKKLAIGFLEPESTCTRRAALKHFGSSLGYKSYNALPKLLDAVLHKEIDFCVVPAESTAYGLAFDIFDDVARSGLKIATQVQLASDHWRFFVLGREPQIFSANVPWQTSLYIKFAESLQQDLDIFAAHGLECTKAKEHPTRKGLAYVDVLGHWDDMQKAAQELEVLGSTVQWLGSYPHVKLLK